MKGGSRDYGFKFQTDQGFWIQISKRARFRIQILNFLGFKFQSNFLGFIFQNGLDSGFKFQIGGIQDSDLGLQGPSIGSFSSAPKLAGKFPDLLLTGNSFICY